MGRRGPPPTPTAVLDARGSWRGRARGRPRRGEELGTSISSLVRMPAPPDDLPDNGRRLYRRICSDLRDRGVSRAVDARAILRYVRLLARWAEADRVILAGQFDGQGKPLPAVVVLNQLEPQLCRLESVLGLTPAARASAGAPAQPKNKKRAPLLPMPAPPQGGPDPQAPLDPQTLVMPQATG